MTTLTISHYIYLSKEERYKLYSGESLNVIGVSVPVWFDRGNTSEPAKELFCRYTITNDSINKAIMPNEEGYHINLPQKVKLDAPNEIQEIVDLYIGTPEKLLDIKDGGSEKLEFKQYNKVNQGSKTFNVIHFVEIKDKELLDETLN
jgi:hypothetical protein